MQGQEFNRIADIELAQIRQGNKLTDLLFVCCNDNIEVPESSSVTHFLQRVDDVTQTKASETSDIAEFASCTSLIEMESNMLNRSVTNWHSTRAGEHVMEENSANEKTTMGKQCVFGQTNIEVPPKNDHNLFDEIMIEPTCKTTITDTGAKEVNKYTNFVIRKRGILENSISCKNTTNITGVQKANSCAKSAVRKNGRLMNFRKGFQLNDESFHKKGQEKMSKQVKCRDCNYSTSKMSIMNRHIKTVHLKIKTHHCEECNVSTVCKSQLKRHIKSVHQKIKNQHCDECNFSSSHKHSLMYHKKAIHLNIKDHKCKDCNYCTSIKSNLKKHIKAVHLKIKDLNCMMCNYSASDKLHLNRHAKRAHNSSSTQNYSK